MSEVKFENIINASENIIAHQVNCFKIGSGIAKEIIKKYPDVYTEHLRMCNEVAKKDRRHLLGNCQLINVEENKWIANLFGQYDFGYDGKFYTNYDALHRSFVTLSEFARFYGLSIALPEKIGCGRGGGDIKIISEMIETDFKCNNITLYNQPKKAYIVNKCSNHA